MPGILNIAKSALEVYRREMESIANNLANVQTTGYKKDRLSFQDTMYIKIKQAGADVNDENQLPSGIMMGTGVKLVATEKNFTQGQPIRTNAPLDICIVGKGFLQVLQPDGTIAYTRDGALKINSSRNLVTANGLQLQPSITIPDDCQSIVISDNGEVSVTRPGMNGTTSVGRLELADFINPVGLEPIGDNLYIETSASGSPTIGDPLSSGLGRLQQGFLEGSNVNSMEELLRMMETQRGYEINTKVLAKDDEMMKYMIQNTG